MNCQKRGQTKASDRRTFVSDECLGHMNASDRGTPRTDECLGQTNASDRRAHRKTNAFTENEGSDKSTYRKHMDRLTQIHGGMDSRSYMFELMVQTKNSNL